MSEILFLCHRVPFPPDRGDKIRSHHILRALAAIAPVHVGTLAESDSDMSQERELGAFACTYHIARRSTPLAIAGALACLRREPVSLTAFRDRHLRDWVDKTLKTRPITAIYVFSGQMGQYVPADFDGRVVLDLVDVDSAKFESYAASGAFPRSLIDTREARLLRREEACLVRRADRTLLVSEAEADLLKSRLPEVDRAKVRSLGNGIDAHHFAPDQVAPQTEISSSDGPHFVFSGQMDYAPNVDAAKRMVRNILPAIRTTHPGARFHIVGRAPTPELRRVDGTGGVKVWGEVDDMRPFLAAADIVVAPLVIARGIQNKVLEAMAMEKPSLISPQAATGIDALPGIHFEMANTDEDFIFASLALLEDRDRRLAMGEAARVFVLKNRSWPAMLKDLSRLIGMAHPAEAQRRAG